MTAQLKIVEEIFNPYKALPPPEEVDLNIKRMVKHACEKSQLFFTRLFHKVREQTTFILSHHHVIFSQFVDGIVSGRITRGIANVPPGYTKTLFFVVDFTARGLAINPFARFVHSTYDEGLALDNSGLIMETIRSDWYQALWPLKIRNDTKAKGLWRTEQGGGLLAASSGGGITGFRAGRMLPGFHGAFLMDDAIKPDDAFSDPLRNRINRRFTNTFKSRLCIESVPFLLIMQRIHADDPTNFLLSGGTGDVWDHLDLPAEISDTPRPVPVEWTHRREFKYELPLGPLWPAKHSQKELDTLKADSYTYNSQYLQRPSALGNEIFKAAYWRYYKTLDTRKNIITLLTGEVVHLKYINIYADTAMKKGEKNDYSVFEVWALGSDGRIYLLDLHRAKWTAPQLETKAIEVYEDWEFKLPSRPLGTRARKVEDKASGTGLIQSINNIKGDGYVVGIPRAIDKVSRAKGAVIQIAKGLVVLPVDAHFTPAFIQEATEFSDTMSHAHDDQLDALFDAIEDMLVYTKGLDYAGAIT